jgi:mono/diheme cytochrome c family protein
MNRIFFFLALAALPAPCQVGPVALYYQFQHPPSTTLVESIRHETTAILSPVGLRLQWKTLPSNGSDMSSDLAVVTFEGRCDSQNLQAASRGGARLGFSHVSDKTVLPFAVVDCDTVGAFIQKKMPIGPDKERERILGRALARVLVHELDHIFAQTMSHGEREVDQPTYTVEELLADNTGGTDSRIHILRSTQAVLPAAKASPTAGHSVFVSSGCAACHGADGEGSRRGPALRAAGRVLSAVVLLTRLARDEETMARRAHALKLPAPSISEAELQDLVSFLNTPPPRP